MQASIRPVSSHPPVLDDARFEGKAWFRETRFEAEASFDRARFSSAMDFTGVSIPDRPGVVDEIATWTNGSATAAYSTIPVGESAS